MKLYNILLIIVLLLLPETTKAVKQAAINWNDRLTAAIKAQDIDQAKAALKNGAKIDLKSSSSGDIPLVLAIRTGNSNLVNALLPWVVSLIPSFSYLIDKNDDATFEKLVNAVVAQFPVAARMVIEGAQRDMGGALLTMSKRGNNRLALLLVNSTPIIDLEDSNKNTPLILASAAGFTDVVTKLLEKGAAIDHQNNLGETALMRATQNNYPEIVKLLLAHNANKNLTNYYGRSALSFAANNKDLIRMLQ